jgi:hypothetical protein
LSQITKILTKITQPVYDKSFIRSFQPPQKIQLELMNENRSLKKIPGTPVKSSLTLILSGILKQERIQIPIGLLF